MRRVRLYSIRAAELKLRSARRALGPKRDWQADWEHQLRQAEVGVLLWQARRMLGTGPVACLSLASKARWDGAMADLRRLEAEFVETLHRLLK